MTRDDRGPPGTAAAPPAWLATHTPAILEIPAGQTLFRIHALGRTPLFFSPGPNQPAAGRFDSPANLFGTLYAAFTFAGAFAETILRNPARRIVGLPELTARALSKLTTRKPLRLAALHGPNLQPLGLDASISTGPYAPCGQWSEALFAHPSHPDGIAYSSRHDPDQLCTALFSRAADTIEWNGTSIPLPDIMGDVAAVLRLYGKGLEV